MGAMPQPAKKEDVLTSLDTASAGVNLNDVLADLNNAAFLLRDIGVKYDVLRRPSNMTHFNKWVKRWAAQSNPPQSDAEIMDILREGLKKAVRLAQAQPNLTPFDSWWICPGHVSRVRVDDPVVTSANKISVNIVTP
jgi:hypothetical protein